MLINKVTFTGVDNNTPIPALQEIQNKYPFVEFGVLISSSHSRNRYPSLDYIDSLRGSGLNLALHLCGIYSKNILSDGIIKLPFSFFNRYQLNFNFSNTLYNWRYLSQLIKKYPDKQFILQYNKSNSGALRGLYSTEGHTARIDLLYDSSGGRGTVISDIKDPFTYQYTGYSGGINPENVNEICEKISSVPYTDRVWIDMESGVRTDDQFDLMKVTQVCQEVYPFIET